MGVWDKIKNIMTIPEEDEFEEDTVQDSVSMEEEETPVRERPRIIKSKSAPKTTTVSSQLQVVLVKPDRFEDVTSIADHLNDGKTVVLNLEDSNREVSRRIVDFLSGAAYANGGNMRKVAKNTFIIAANGVDVMGELMLEDFEEKSYF